MSKTIAGLAGAACLLFAATAANAATLSGSGTHATGAASSSVILAHGIHTTCQRDKRGWHRSYPWRKACAKENHWRPGWKKHDHKKNDWNGKGKGKDKHH